VPKVINTNPLRKGLGFPGRGILPIRQQDLLNREQSSEAIQTVTYNPETMVMEIVFNKRGTYAYLNVPPDVFADFNTAGSRGTYFNLYIRNSGYEYERIA